MESLRTSLRLSERSAIHYQESDGEPGVKARERAILISGKDGEAAYVGFIGDAAGRSPEIKRAARSQSCSPTGS